MSAFIPVWVQHILKFKKAAPEYMNTDAVVFEDSVYVPEVAPVVEAAPEVAPVVEAAPEASA